METLFRRRRQRARLLPLVGIVVLLPNLVFDTAVILERDVDLLRASFAADRASFTARASFSRRLALDAPGAAAGGRAQIIPRANTVS